MSTKTSGISNILDEANLEGGCPLALAVLYEIAQKERSPWYGYLQALPEQGEDLPNFWNDEEKEWFRGTEMEIPVYKGYVKHRIQTLRNASIPILTLSCRMISQMTITSLSNLY